MIGEVKGESTERNGAPLVVPYHRILEAVEKGEKRWPYDGPNVAGIAWLLSVGKPYIVSRLRALVRQGWVERFERFDGRISWLITDEGRWALRMSRRDAAGIAHVEQLMEEPPDGVRVLRGRRV